MASSTGGVRSRQKSERVSGAAESSHPEAEGPEGPRPQASSELARVRQRREVKRVTWSSERVAREGKVKAAGGGEWAFFLWGGYFMWHESHGPACVTISIVSRAFDAGPTSYYARQRQA